MYSENITIKNKSGLHARPAFMFVNAASKFTSNITVKKDDKTASSKSIVNILALGIGSGSEIVISAEGADEKEAVKSLIELINSNFGEE